jgi:hypothetical protein
VTEENVQPSLKNFIPAWILFNNGAFVNSKVAFFHIKNGAYYHIYDFLTCLFQKHQQTAGQNIGIEE